MMIAGTVAGALFLLAEISGQVIDVRTEEPVPYAVIRVERTALGAVADASGAFRVSVPDTGSATLLVSSVGYRKKSLTVDPRRAGPQLMIGLEPQAILLGDVVVTPNYSLDDRARPSRSALSKMDVYTSPGSAADYIYSIKDLPGVGGNPDAAPIVFRGGDPNEVLYLLNGALLRSPFHLEGAGGGMFSVIDEEFVRNVNISSGGFGVLYGRKMSGVVDVTLEDRFTDRALQGSLGLNLAGVTLEVEKKGLGVSAWRNDTGLLASAFEFHTSFTVFPAYSGLQANYNFDLGAHLKARSFLVLAQDVMETSLEDLDVEGNYRQAASKGLAGVQVRGVEGPVTFRTTLSSDARWTTTRVGPVIDYDNHERGYALRCEAEAGAFTAGVDVDHERGSTKGVFPEDAALWWDPRVTRDTVRVSGTVTRGGVYAEAKRTLWAKTAMQIGLRSDYDGDAKETTIDPRIALVHSLPWEVTLRGAWGVYHQPWEESAGVAHALHHVVSLEKSTDAFQAKLEGYYKDYRDLPLLNRSTGSYAPNGSGSSYGAELFLKKHQGSRFSGWMSYTLSWSERKEGETPELRPFDYDSRHMVTLSGLADLGSSWQIGAKAKYASGRPYTPLAGRVQEGDGYLPVWGRKNSSRFADYVRLDLRLTKLDTVAGRPVVFYLECLNVTDRRNPIGSIYTKDYSERREIVLMPRMAVLGLSLMFR